MERKTESGQATPVMEVHLQMSEGDSDHSPSGRPIIDRRPQPRPLGTEPQRIIDEWFDRSGLRSGDAVQTLEQQNKAKCLCYTWKDCFVMTLNDLWATDLVEHTIDVEEGSIPFRLKQPFYSADERKFASRLFPQMESAGLIYPGISPWGAYAQFPIKKSGDRRVVMNDN
ncbi:hypothetical protein GGR54DRAFT_606028 [Hypoxylon sp. NC1633]|nr:hypothetical protein GGR54DRAFT_606028 [Hypoxylon sp. NC1633]